VAPKEDFAYFNRSRVLNVTSPLGTWSVTCFYVAAKWRDKGVAAALLREAMAFAKRDKAAAVEGYPVVPSSQRKIPAAFAWTGVPGLFAKAGFKKLKRLAGVRPIYRLDF
jgi:ribosomal protein S18 acetylase RimI-like enzyme